MKGIKKLYLMLVLFMVSTLQMMAQQKITGRVIDDDGFAVPYASVQYKGHKIGVSSDGEGKFTIEKHPAWVLTVSALSYKTQTVKIDEKINFIEVKLKDDTHKLSEVVVKSKKGKYKRKDNPAVELMRRVIAAKKKSDLSNHDYYQYDKYQKITLALNDLSKEQLESKFFSKRQYLLDQVETSPYNGKLTLPVSVDETVSQHIYRKDPKTEKDIIKGQQSNGIGQVIQTGEILNTALKEVFTDVDIYDDYVRLLQYPFPSPIGKTAISFYHYYIEDTVENYVEVAHKNQKDDKRSIFDLGPVNTFISNNFVDGLRLRLAGRTMAALNPHFFWDGYGAYGTKSHEWYYGHIFTYSLNKKKNSPFEFPMRKFTFEVGHDITSPSDDNLLHNKDNLFMTIRATTQDQMYLYQRQKFGFTYETDWGFRFDTSIRWQSNRPVGNLHYFKLDGTEVKKIRTTEASVGIDYNPGVTYVNTKQQRLPINLDSPELMLSHTMGLDGFMGGQYQSNITRMSIYKRQWLGSFGYVDFNIVGKIQWNKVPFTMLIQPPVNLSYFEQEATISMMKDWEFLSDRQAFWSVAWDMNGKLLNRIPLIKKLKWREYVAVKGVWGQLTDKNNPVKNPTDDVIFQFPNNSYTFGNTPYWEVVAGVHNIFKFFGIDYVRRLNYLDHANVDKWGIRLGFLMTF